MSMLRIPTLGRLPRLGAPGGGGAAAWTPKHAELNNTWYPALKLTGSQRASVACIGDSVTDGFSATNQDATDYVSVLRSLMQTRYGDGGEGLVLPVHTTNSPEAGWELPPNHRWTFSASAWTINSQSTRAGWGCVGANCYWSNVGFEPQITGTFDTLQIITGIKFDSTTNKLLNVLVDGNLVGTIDESSSLANHSLFAPGTIVSYTGFVDGSHAVKLDMDAAVAVLLEGVRFLRGSAGVVIDRMAKAGLRAEWLGTINDSDYTNYNYYYKALTDCFIFDPKLSIVMLGINDYSNQVALATFETALTAIAQRAKTHSDTILIAPPAPNNNLTIPFSSYVSTIQTVAAATGCLFLNVYERWGSQYNASYMENAVHPNNAGHADIAAYLIEALTL